MSIVLPGSDASGLAARAVEQYFDLLRRIAELAEELARVLAESGAGALVDERRGRQPDAVADLADPAVLGMLVLEHSLRGEGPLVPQEVRNVRVGHGYLARD